MHFGVLGPLEVRDDDGNLVELGGRQPRVMVAALLLGAGRAVPVESLIDAVWGDSPPSSAAGTLQSYVSRLRRRLGADAIVFEPAGYRLVVDHDQVDFRRFEALADRGSNLLERGELDQARTVLLEAEALWRGPALSDLAELEFATGTASRLDLRRLTTIEDRIEAELRLGRHTTVVDELGALVAANPLRERLQAQLALAQYRAGRQADALRSIADASRTLREELGIEPSPELRELEARILAHDPTLELRPPASPPPPVNAPPVGAPPGTAPDAPPPAEPRAGPGSDRLVGRESELAELVSAFDESTTSARFIVIEGEPGIGKTRLTDELRSITTARGAMAVWGRSDEGGAAPALWPWLVPLRVLAERTEDVPDEVAELLRGQTPMSAGQAQSTQFDRFEAVAGWLAAIARRVPLVLLLDDLQWADETSLELLTFLAGRLDAGVTIVGTMRQLEVGRRDAATDALAAIARRPGSRRLVLRGLSAADTATLLDVAANRAVDQSAAATIHARAEGNPFYAIELARLLDEEGVGSRDVPGSVGDVIRRRLAGLPDGTTELLRTAAVVGRDVDLALLARTADADLDDVLDALDPAVAHRLLVEVPERPMELRFSHALVREVLLEDLTALRRARLHLRVADAIEAAGAGTDDAEILAEHLWRAAPVGVGLRAADALERAAEVAQHRVAYAAAEVLLI
jgi:DNA-binding SARP family transcriptional activator